MRIALSEVPTIIRTVRVLIANPDNAEPTSFGLTKHYHPTAHDIVQRVAQMLDIDIPLMPLSPCQHDVPGDWFKGPF